MKRLTTFCLQKTCKIKQSEDYLIFQIVREVHRELCNRIPSFWGVKFLFSGKVLHIQVGRGGRDRRERGKEGKRAVGMVRN